VNLTLLLVLAGLAAGLTNGSFAVLLTDLFPTRIRFTGAARAFNVRFTPFSAIAPLVASTQIRDTNQMASRVPDDGWCVCKPRRGSRHDCLRRSNTRSIRRFFISIIRATN
jgi:hypothetical protein